MLGSICIYFICVIFVGDDRIPEMNRKVGAGDRVKVCIWTDIAYLRDTFHDMFCSHLTFFLLLFCKIFILLFIFASFLLIMMLYIVLSPYN